MICEVGVDGLSMRRLADELHVTPMALYNHVKNKDHLLVLVADAVLSSVEIPPSRSAPWYERLGTIMERIRAAANRYPGVGTYLLSTFHDLLPRREVGLEMIRILLEAGFDEDQVAYAVATLNTLALGRFRIDAEPRHANRMVTTDRGKGAAQQLEAVRDRLRSAAGDDFFRHSLQTVLQGLRAELGERTS